MSPLTETNPLKSLRTTDGILPAMLTGRRHSANLISTEELKQYPWNEKLNPLKEHKEEFENLKRDMEDRYQKNLKEGKSYGNYEAVIVCPKTKYLFSGNYRQLAAIELGIPYLKFEWSDVEYNPDLSEEQHFHLLEDFNSSAKRDETKPTTAVRKWKLLQDSHYAQYGKYYTNKDSGVNSESSPLMQTDSETLMKEGCKLAGATWEKAKQELSWTKQTPAHIFCHQVGQAQRKLMYETVQLDMQKDFSTLEFMGNTGSASLPITFKMGIPL